jgi:hypothetical protein
MIPKEFLFLFFIVIIVILSVMLHKYRERFSEEIPNCICAFDIDGTITTGVDRAGKAIARAKELGCKIAINTARPSKWYSDLDLHSLGLNKSDFDSDFYHGAPFECSFTNIKCFEDSIATTKVNHLYTLSQKWNVKPNKIILFDDQWPNIEKAKQAGFGTVFANHHLGGLPSNVVELMDKILAD